MTLRLSAVERQAILDGTDPVSARHRFRAPLLGDRPEQLADLPAERDFSLDDWQDEQAEQAVDMDPEDRSLTGEIGPGYDRRCFGVDEL